MERPLIYVHTLSLEEMAMRKFVACLWNDIYILDSRRTFPYQVFGYDKWKTLNDNVKRKILRLQLPESFTKRMVDIILPIGLEIKGWEDFYRNAFNISPIGTFEPDSAKLFFTSAGTVDDRRTAQEIVRCDKLNVVPRYRLACAYWMEDYIPLLWEKLSEGDQEFFSEKDFVARGLEYSWPYISKCEWSKMEDYLTQFDRNLTSFNQWAFEHSARKGNKPTVEYFFQKLTHEEREVSLMRSAINAASNIPYDEEHIQRKLRNVFHYLLSVMTPEQQTKVVRMYPVLVMSCFFDWSRRELFSQNADLIWPLLHPRLYNDLLTTYFKFRIIHSPELFIQSPLDFKKYVLESDRIRFYFPVHLLTMFFKREDSPSIEAMFRCADAATRIKLVFNRGVLGLFHHSLANDKRHLVELCLREAMLSREDRKRLKSDFARYREDGYIFYFHCYASGETVKMRLMKDRDPKLKSFLDFLYRDDTSAKEENRSLKRKLEYGSPEL